MPIQKLRRKCNAGEPEREMVIDSWLIVRSDLPSASSALLLLIPSLQCAFSSFCSNGLFGFKRRETLSAVVPGERHFSTDVALWSSTESSHSLTSDVGPEARNN